MADVIIPICYFWSFCFLAAAAYYVLKRGDKFNFLIGTYLFGNCFSVVFWVTTAIAKALDSIVLPNLVLQIFGCISIVFFIVFIITGIQLRLDAKKSYPN